MECSNCRKENMDSSKFCIRCGEKLEKIELRVDNENDDAILFCNECGNKIVANIIFCSKCGYKLTNKKAEVEKHTEKDKVNKKEVSSKLPSLIVAVMIVFVVGLYAIKSINSPAECEECGQVEKLRTYVDNDGDKYKLCNDCYRLEKLFSY